MACGLTHKKKTSMVRFFCFLSLDTKYAIFSELVIGFALALYSTLK